MLSRFSFAWVLAVISATTARTAELRTYHFTATEHRPFTRQCGECSFAVSANLVGEFDLLLDHNSNLAQLKRLDIRLGDTVNGYRPSMQLPEFDGVPLTEMWPIDLTMLSGQFISPHAVQVAGPGPVHFIPSSHGGPNLGYDPQDFIQNLPGGVVFFPSTIQTAIRIHSDVGDFAANMQDPTAFGHSVIVDGIAINLFTEDAGEYYIQGATASLVRSAKVPEPSTLAFGCLLLLRATRRRRW